MTARLDAKLKQYEKSAPITSDPELSAALRSILAAEEQKDFDERDYDMISELTDEILTLGGTDVDSFEATSEDAAAFRRKAEKRSAQNAESAGSTARRRTSGRVRWIVPIAAIVAALAVGAAVASSFGLNVLEMASDLYNSLVVGERYSSGDEQLEKTDEGRAFDNYDGLFASDDMGAVDSASLLVPASLPDGWEIAGVSADRLTDCELVVTTLSHGEKSARIEARLGLDRQAAPGTEPIGAYAVLVSEYDGICQGEFSVGKDYYLIQAPDRETLTAIIEGLEVAEK